MAVSTTSLGFAGKPLDRVESSAAMPNPFRPAPRPSLTRASIGLPYFAPGREEQRQRRARILAVVRQQLAEVGSRHITIRTVARMSGVSMQTIYNLVGNRAQMIVDAVSEQITLVTRQSLAENDYPNIILSLADVLWRHVKLWPEYVHQANAIYFSEDREIYYRLREEQIKRLVILLRRQRDVGLLRDHVDVELLAEHIALLTGTLSLEWSDNRFSLDELRTRLISGYGYLLGGALVPSEAKKTERWLANFRDSNQA